VADRPIDRFRTARRGRQGTGLAQACRRGGLRLTLDWLRENTRRGQSLPHFADRFARACGKAQGPVRRLDPRGSHCCRHPLASTRPGRGVQEFSLARLENRRVDRPVGTSRSGVSRKCARPKALASWAGCCARRVAGDADHPRRKASNDCLDGRRGGRTRRRVLAVGGRPDSLTIKPVPGARRRRAVRAAAREGSIREALLAGPHENQVPDCPDLPSQHDKGTSPLSQARRKSGTPRGRGRVSRADGMGTWRGGRGEVPAELANYGRCYRRF